MKIFKKKKKSNGLPITASTTPIIENAICSAFNNISLFKMKGEDDYLNSLQMLFFAKELLHGRRAPLIRSVDSVTESTRDYFEVNVRSFMLYEKGYEHLREWYKASYLPDKTIDFDQVMDVLIADWSELFSSTVAPRIVIALAKMLDANDNKLRDGEAFTISELKRFSTYISQG